jgi:hypothetical protein
MATTHPPRSLSKTSGAIDVRNKAISTLLTTMSQKLSPPVLQRAVMMLLDDVPLGVGGIGFGNEIEDAAHLCARQAMNAVAISSAVPQLAQVHQNVAHLYMCEASAPVQIKQVADPEHLQMSAVPGHEQARDVLRTISSSDVDTTGAKLRLTHTCSAIADATAPATLIRVPDINPPPGTLFALMPRSRQLPPIRAVATHLVGLARARATSASSMPSMEWRLRVCWLGRNTNTLLSLDDICCKSGDRQLPQLALQWVDDAVSLARREDPQVVDWWASERAHRSGFTTSGQERADEVEEGLDHKRNASDEDTEELDDDDSEDDMHMSEEAAELEIDRSAKDVDPPIGYFHQHPNLCWSRLMENSQDEQHCQVMENSSNPRPREVIHSRVVYAAAAADAAGGLYMYLLYMKSCAHKN